MFQISGLIVLSEGLFVVLMLVRIGNHRLPCLMQALEQRVCFFFQRRVLADMDCVTPVEKVLTPP